MRSRKPAWSPRARADLFEDHGYIAHENSLAADRFFLDIYRKVEAFARNGLTGTDRREFGDGIRSFTYRERIIFFKLSDTELTVLRVLHGRQNISPSYFQDSET
ncbi:type II toxin-antitoxin system RelE/ParE family toxin [Rhizobium wenxiniae]|uniref:type II toxin-antitoxin system RelE/ParE family toxin n=1 Tax=Rhizobium wenxiniae TaxID=1737357 RepID=UPI001C6F1D51|nr:type II toxin-antitoxin system RelE/ParE family toxin [Rhizobium wenxiniae]